MSQNTDHEERRLPEQINIAVKEALDDRRMEEMGKQLTDLSKQMAEGFAKVGIRQDGADAKITGHDLAIQKINDKQGEGKTTWYVITTLTGIVIALATYLILNPR